MYEIDRRRNPEKYFMIFFTRYGGKKGKPLIFRDSMRYVYLKMRNIIVVSQECGAGILYRLLHTW